MAETVESFGNYEILSVLGRGGFATVYRARDPQLDRHIALKTLQPDLTEDGTIRRRFLAKARAIARISGKTQFNSRGSTIGPQPTWLLSGFSAAESVRCL